MVGAEPIRLDEVLAELARLRQAAEEGPPGFTCQELATVLGLCPSSVQKYLAQLVKNNRVALVGHRPALSISGRRCHIPVYQLTPNPGGTISGSRAKQSR